jgi:hypothetical protein
MPQYFYPTASQIIDDALMHIRAIDPEASVTPTTSQRTQSLRTLNAIVTSWQAKGFQVWCTKNQSVTLVAGQTSYTWGPSGDISTQRPLSVSQAWLHNTSENTDPLQMQIFGREEYNRYTNKEAESVPYGVYYDPQYDGPATNSGANAKGKLFVYPAPSTTAASTYTLTVVYTRPIQDFNATSDTLDFPQEWYNALIWNLASQLCPSYGVPVMYWDRIKAEAKEQLDIVSGWDREEGSSFIQPAYK